MAGPGAAVEPQAVPAATASRSGNSVFAGKVTAVFATRILVLVITMFTSLAVTRLLVTAHERGAYVAVVTLPGMLSALAMLGLPGAVNYFAGRGSSVDSLIKASLAFTLGISATLVALVWLSLPWLEQSVLQAAPDNLLRLILIVIPAGMLTAFGGTLLYGRQEVKVYNAILLMQALGSLAGVIVLVGVLGLGVSGAVATSIVVSLVTVTAVCLELLRLRARDRRGQPASMRTLVAYGTRLYPANVSTYFNYRADNYIIQAVAPSVEAAQSSLGLYSWAVTMAEVVFLVPDSVSAMFLPRVAGSSPEVASAMLARVARVTILISLLVAVLLIPTAFVGVYAILPHYVDCLPAFVAILPGVTALCVCKVTGSYVIGRGRPGTASLAAMLALFINVPLNFALIPMLGIVGASLSSVVSYSVMALATTLVASRISGQSLASMCVPRREDAVFVASSLSGILQRLLRPGRLWRGRSHERG